MSIQIEIVPTGGKFHVIMNGVTIHKAGNRAAAEITVERERKKHGDKLVELVDGHPGVGGESVVEKFDINQRFEFLRMAVADVASGDANAVIIVGQGGLGKTHTVLESLAEAGLQDYDQKVALKAEEMTAAKSEEDLAGIDLSTIHVPKFGTYKMVKGHSSAKALYRTLWENHDGVLVFDDCDSIQKDMTSLNLLKGALDSSGERIISWLSEGFIDDGLPRSFKFQGRVIFISNRPLETWDSAVKSRALTINVTMTKMQVIDRMRHMVETDSFLPEVSKEDKRVVLDILDENKDQISSLNLRNLMKGSRAYAKNKNVDYVTYLMTNAKD